MNIKQLAVVGVCSIVLAGCTLGEKQETSQDEAMMEESQTTEVEAMGAEESATQPEAMMARYSLEEVSTHKTAEDCWLVVNDSVYDVSEYVTAQKHPGGDVIAQNCGTEVTEAFFDRPNGSGPHSEKAQGFLETMMIGLVQTAQ